MALSAFVRAEILQLAEESLAGEPDSALLDRITAVKGCIELLDGSPENAEYSSKLWLRVTELLNDAHEKGISFGRLRYLKGEL